MDNPLGISIWEMEPGISTHRLPSGQIVTTEVVDMPVPEETERWGPARSLGRGAHIRPVNKLCVYCGEIATQSDHIWPSSRGGPDTLNNLVPACGPCNNSKGSKYLIEWSPAKVMRAARVSPEVASELQRLWAARQL